MKIALIGYGNMGQEIERVVTEQGKHTIVSVSLKSKDESLDKNGISKADVAIDFTSPEVVLKNIQEIVSVGTPLVVGTTGWYNSLPEVREIVATYKGSFMYGQNFSIGANIFFKIVGFASSLIGDRDGYDVFGLEAHHTGKKDSPSGTARKLAEIVIENFQGKTTLQTEKLDRSIEHDEMHFASVRGGRNFGKHEIVFDSQADEIRLMHQAWGRRGFAEGSVLAAEFIRGKKGVFNFSDEFDQILKEVKTT